MASTGLGASYNYDGGVSDKRKEEAKKTSNKSSKL